jgi:hypothetical protein
MVHAELWFFPTASLTLNKMAKTEERFCVKMLNVHIRLKIVQNIPFPTSSYTAFKSAALLLPLVGKT